MAPHMVLLNGVVLKTELHNKPKKFKSREAALQFLYEKNLPPNTCRVLEYDKDLNNIPRWSLADIQQGVTYCGLDFRITNQERCRNFVKFVEGVASVEKTDKISMVLYQQKAQQMINLYYEAIGKKGVEMPLKKKSVTKKHERDISRLTSPRGISLDLKLTKVDLKKAGKIGFHKGSMLGKVYDLVTSGMTVEQFLKVTHSKKINKVVALKSMQGLKNKGLVKLK